MTRRGNQSQSARAQSLSPKRAVRQAVIETMERRVLLSAIPSTLHPLVASPAVRAFVSPAPSVLPLRVSGALPLTLPTAGLDPQVLAATVKAPPTKMITAGNVTLNSAATSSVFSNPGSITIPSSGAATPYPSTITVSGVSGTISDVNVTIKGLTHTNPDDLDILLVGPSGEKIILMSDCGGTPDVSSINLTFDDEAAVALPDSTLITAGTYRPTNVGTSDTFSSPAPASPYGTIFSTFDATSANGTWSLYVMDDAGSSSGSIANGWEIALTTNDDFANRSDLGSVNSAVVTGSNVGCTSETGEPAQSGTINSAWWSWTAPRRGILTVDTNGSALDTFLTLATGSAVNSVTVLAQNDDNGSGGTWGRIASDVSAGTQYQIAIDGHSGNTGTFLLNVSFVTPVYVDASLTSGSHDGSSWSNAYQDLQAALTAAVSGTRILVAGGTYTPTSGTDRTTSFQLKNGVEIAGGYAGDANPGNPSARDISLYLTTLSGNIGTPGSQNDNSYHVLVGSGTDSTGVLDGFTITAGNASGTSSPTYYGGGLYNSSGSPTIRNCTFTGNSATGIVGNSSTGDGGGIYNYSYSSPTLINCAFTGNAAGDGAAICNWSYSSPTLTDCTFSSNSTKRNYGGGIYNYASSSPTLTNCTFSGNTAGFGGGIHNSSSSPTLTNCVFTENSANNYGGAVDNVDSSSPMLTNCTFTGNWARLNGGGMYNLGSSPTLLDCTFSANSTTESGGGMHNQSSSAPSVTNCTFSENSSASGGGMYNDSSAPSVINCRFSRNSATTKGGAIDISYVSSATVTNCTFTGNSVNGAGAYGGAIHITGSSPELTNCIFSGNSANGAGAVGGAIATRAPGDPSLPTMLNCTFSGNSASGNGGAIFSDPHSSLTVTSCILWSNTAAIGGAEIYESGGATTVIYSDIQDGFTGAGNMNTDPLFVRNPDPASGDYGDLRLQLASLCIDAGNNSAVPPTITSDLAGNARIVGGTVDMGAYEQQMTPLALSGGGGNDPFYARLSLGGSRLQVWNSLSAAGNPSQTYPSHSLAACTFSLAGGDDTLSFDFSNGSLSCPVIFDGGTHTTADTLRIIGASAIDAFTATTTQIVHGSFTLTYSGIENRTFGPGLFTFTDPLTIADGTLLSLNPGGGITLKLAGGLSFGPLLTGKLDLNDNDLVIQSTAGSKAGVLTQVTNWIKSGLDTGRGILSTSAGSEASSATALGVMINDNGIGAPLYPTFSGLSGLDANTILVKYTWYGDSNLDGSVGRTDYMMLNVGTAAGGTRTGWRWGDFDYNQNIDGLDYDLIDRGADHQNQVL